MQTTSWEVLSALLHHYHPDDYASMLKYFPAEGAKLLEHAKRPIAEKTLALQTLLEAIQQIHYSWFHKPIHEHPKNLIPFLISSLPKEHVSGLEKMQQHSYETCIVPPVFQSFFLKILYKQIGADFVLPVNYLPDTELKILLKLSKIQLTRLIDYLGLYDLGATLQQIVDKRSLENIMSMLSPGQCKCLKKILHAKLPTTATSLINIHSCRSAPELYLQIHKKGLQRFSKALAGQNSHFIWHICHRLDIGRGEKLLQLMRHKEATTNTTIITKQVLEVVSLFNTKEA